MSDLELPNGDSRPSEARFVLPFFEDRTVKPFELFFDLVFVFALTQVTLYVESHLDWQGFGEGVALLATLWLMWSSYAWVGASIDLEEGPVRLVMIAAMGVLLVTALAVPRAFDDSAIIFAVGYAAIRGMQMLLFAVGARSQEGLLQATLQIAPSATLGPGLILVGAITETGPLVVWIGVAMVGEYLYMLFMDVSGFQVSPSFFSERHGLIFIVALGEALISVGIGASGLELTGSVIGATLLGFGIIVAMWWTYFDVNAIAGERQLSALVGVAQVRAAQHAYTYLHLSMMIGIVFFSLGAKETLAHPDEPVQSMVAFALVGGPALYLLSQIGFRGRLAKSLSIPRTVAVVGYLSLLLIEDKFTAIALLTAATAIMTVLVTYEAWAHRVARRAVRRSHEIRWE